MKTIETARLTLRAWRLDDLDDFYAYARSRHVGPAAGWKPHESRAESEAILRAFIEADETWAIVPKSSGRAVGSIGLHEDPMRKAMAARMMGYVLAPSVWGRGLGTEAARAVAAFAFEELEVEVLSIRHYPENDRSRRVIEKCGFSCEGTLRRAVRRYDGAVLDVVCYSMLPEEYRALAGKKGK